MFKSIIFTLTSICLAVAAHAQEKKELSVPAFFAPSTVQQTAASVAAGDESAKADVTQGDVAKTEIGGTHNLEFTAPASGAKVEIRTNKPIRVIAEGNKVDPQVSAPPVQITDSK